MPPDTARLAELTRTLEATGRKYNALAQADAFKAANTALGPTVTELNQTAAAKSDWEAADIALAIYRVSYQ